MIISGPKVYLENEMLLHGAVVINNEFIEKISDQPIKTDALVFPDTYHLVPGFVDLHVHGVNDCDVMDASVTALNGISEALAAEGTTAFLATTMTSSIPAIENALVAVRDAMARPAVGAKILGVHLEGPFISAKKAGAQNADHVLKPNEQHIQHWQDLSANAIKLVTLAPELSNSVEFIRYLKKQHIIAAMGHTDATYAETMNAIHAGCDYATHVFNAMRGIHQREPGAVTAALLSESVWTELIVDGVHLHPAIIEMILKLKTADKMVLVTDAMRAKCLHDGCYELGGQEVIVKDHVARLTDGTLAGSLLTMPNAIANMLQFAKCDLLSAIKMASANPARILNIYDKKGSIAPGKDADLVVLDEQFNVVLTVAEGRIIYQTHPVMS